MLKFVLTVGHFCKRLLHKYEKLPFTRVNVEALSTNVLTFLILINILYIFFMLCLTVVVATPQYQSWYDSIAVISYFIHVLQVQPRES